MEKLYIKKREENLLSEEMQYFSDHPGAVLILFLYFPFLFNSRDFQHHFENSSLNTPRKKIVMDFFKELY